MILAAIIAVTGGVAFGRYLSSLPDPSGEGPLRPVLLAAFALERGRVLAETDLRTGHVPASYLPPEALDDPRRAVGRTLLTRLAAGEPLTETRLGRAGGGPVGSLVPDGFRAFPVASSLPATALRAGDRVDVLATFAGGQPHTETLVAGAEVLTLLGSSGGGASGPGGVSATDVSGGSETELTVMLLVTPEDAERLAYARAFADLALSIAPTP